MRISITSINFLDNHISKPKAIILLDAAVYKTELPFFVEYLRIPVISNLLLFFTSADYRARFTLNRIYYDKSKVTLEKVDRYSYFIKLDGYSYALKKTAEQITPDNFEQYTNRYREILTPTLVIWGKQDPAIPLSSGQRLVKELPNATLEVINLCGHNPQEEWPEKTAGLILSFINEVNE